MNAMTQEEVVTSMIPQKDFGNGFTSSGTLTAGKWKLPRISRRTLPFTRKKKEQHQDLNINHSSDTKKTTNRIRSRPRFTKMNILARNTNNHQGSPKRSEREDIQALKHRFVNHFAGMDLNKPFIHQKRQRKGKSKPTTEYKDDDDSQSLTCLTQDDVEESSISSSSFLQKEDSFETLATASITSVTESDDALDDYDDQDETIVFSECSSRKSVRFADEEGLPMEQIYNVESFAQHQAFDDNGREYSELVVLCLCPRVKKFEFLHVAYYGTQSDKQITLETEATSVQDLLHNLPGMCTNDIFAKATFETIYRTNSDIGTLDKLILQESNIGTATNNGNITESRTGSPSSSKPSLLLQDCALGPFDVMVAPVSGCTDEEVLDGVDPLMRNVHLMKTLKRARRSRRGLKFVSSSESDSSLGSDRRGIDIIAEIFRRIFLVGLHLVGLGFDEDEEDADEILGTEIVKTPLSVQEELMRGIYIITTLTILFSALGL